jgi:hypothetical protein
MTLRTLSQLATDFPVDNFNLPRTVSSFDRMIIRCELAGAEVVQAFGAIGAALQAIAEPISPPTGAYTGTAGSTTQAYAVVPEYPLAGTVQMGSASGVYPSGLPANLTSILSQYSNLGPAVAGDANALGGMPLEGRGANGSARVKRYGQLSTTLLVGSTLATLSTSAFVNVTLPSFTSQYTAKTPTLALLKPNGSVAIGGTFHLGDTISVGLGASAVSVTVTSGMTNLAGIAAALQAALIANPSAAAMCVSSLNGSTLFFYGGSGAGLAAAVSGTGATVTAVASGSTLNGGGVLATGLAPGSTFRDIGAFQNSTAQLPGYAEVGIIPATSATGSITLTGIWQAGQVLTTFVPGVGLVSYTTTSGDANMSGSATSFAAAIKTAVRAFTAGGTGYTSFNATATAATIAMTFGVTGVAGNSMSFLLGNATTPISAESVTIVPVFAPGVAPGFYDLGANASPTTLGGGTAGGLQLGSTSTVGQQGAG